MNYKVITGGGSTRVFINGKIYSYMPYESEDEGMRDAKRYKAEAEFLAAPQEDGTISTMRVEESPIGKTPLIERIAWSIAGCWPLIMVLAIGAAYLVGFDAFISAWAVLLGSILLPTIGLMGWLLYSVWSD